MTHIEVTSKLLGQSIYMVRDEDASRAVKLFMSMSDTLSADIVPDQRQPVSIRRERQIIRVRGR